MSRSAKTFSHGFGRTLNTGSESHRCMVAGSGGGRTPGVALGVAEAAGAGGVTTAAPCTAICPISRMYILQRPWLSVCQPESNGARRLT